MTYQKLQKVPEGEVAWKRDYLSGTQTFSRSLFTIQHGNEACQMSYFNAYAKGVFVVLSLKTINLGKMCKLR